MRINFQSLHRRIVNGVLIALFLAILALIIYPALVGHLPLVPPWVAEHARQRAPLVQVGMTDAEVWSTLGLSGRGLKAHVSGSGSPLAYPANYVLWPGYVMHMRWNLRTHPATLVEFEFKDRM